MSILNSLVLVYFLVQSLTNATKPRKLVTNLVHRDSIISPFYNPIHGIKDRADRILNNSLARFNYLQRKRNTNFQVDATTYQAKVEVDDHGFLVNLSIGQPPVPQLVILDTGSKLFWVQCKPCQHCFHQKTPIYDPSLSSSYLNLPCNDSICNHIPNTQCDPSGDCTYQIYYMDKSSSKGHIGTEKITFNTPDDGVGVLNDVVLGCGHENNLQAGGAGSGVLGLGYSRTSIVNKIGLRFSYCIGNVHDPRYIFNQLILGDSAIMEGYSTDIDIMNGFYYLTLEGISLGEERLEIDSDLFKKNWNGEGGTIIDSGSELTFINEVAFGVIREKVDSILNGFLKTYVLMFDTHMLCYQGIVSRDLVGFPVATFHFGEGAELVLDIESLFYQINNDAFCLALIPVASHQHTVIGILAQQYYNVGYDLVEERIFFQRIDCQALQD
ncbi:aspartic proteinase CDR1-like [Euphorbia lathyris]|uniref:aspartic proteinase CDR1-like n=1 Tax=Euphorbia lathyris TaxID=212925 RepID=UPI0033131E68